MKDTIFEKPISKQFEFDDSVASVFDDMLSRSVPHYKLALDLSVRFALDYATKNKIVYDLGCSTGTVLLELFRSNKDLKLIGIDSSEAMLKLAQNKSNAFGANLNLICGDILNEKFESCDVVISNYTLQFIRPLVRDDLVKKIFDALDVGGVFIFSEKVITEDKKLHNLFIQEYYDYKRKQGYSDFEIAQKREALENVLIPYSEDENKQMVLKAGFSKVETIFKWVNFATFIAIK